MKLSTQPYKGTRDFFPEDLAIQKFLFDAMKRVCERYGYTGYDSTMIEQTDLYRAKSGEEIVNEQTYTFTDRGGRDVTIRPEMTPTVARMIARKRQELPFPVRWYSIPNLFRYENPQRGRLREHWQLNVDSFGGENLNYDVEMIEVAAQIMLELGATQKDFNILINSRRLINAFYSSLNLNENQSHTLSKLIDRRKKMPNDVFEKNVEDIVSDKKPAVMTFLNAKRVTEVKKAFGNLEGFEEINTVIATLESKGFSNAKFSPDLMRGFDYYTGIVFELFDTDPQNARSLAGGGKYDDLVGLFGVQPIGGRGFGMGDVVLRDFLDIRGLLPKYTATTQVYLCALSESEINAVDSIADELRKKSITVATIYEIQKVPKHIKRAEKLGIEYFMCIGEDETKNKTYTLKNLEKREETTGSIDDIVKVLQS